MKLRLLASILYGICTFPLICAGSVPSIDSDIITSVTMERTACFGDCPSYRVTIFQDGGVVFEGRANVAKVGIERYEIHRDEFYKLAERILRMQFGMLDNRYDDTIDSSGRSRASHHESSRIINVSYRSGSKTVVNVNGAPPRLIELEEEIDKVAGISEKLKRPH